MTEKEHRDVYIAAAVGGLGLILVLLYLFGGTQGAAPVTTDDQGNPLPSVAATPPPDATPYNFNIAPYNPSPGIQYGASGLQPINGGGCCDDCGPSTGSQYFNTNVAQFQTLLNLGGTS